MYKCCSDLNFVKDMIVNDLRRLCDTQVEKLFLKQKKEKEARNKKAAKEFKYIMLSIVERANKKDRELCIPKMLSETADLLKGRNFDVVEEREENGFLFEVTVGWRD